MSAKIHNQKGKSPDFKLRFLNYISVKKNIGYIH